MKTLFSSLLFSSLLFFGCNKEAEIPPLAQPKTQNEFMLPDGVTFPDLQVVPKPDNDPIPAQNLAQLIYRQAQMAAQSDEGLFDFAKTDAYTVWSGVVTSDSIVVLGYAPEGTTTIDWANYDPQSYEWHYARAYTLAYILKELQSSYPDEQFLTEQLIYQEAEYLPILYLRVSDYDLISKLQQLPTVRYIEPAGFKPELYNNSAVGQRSGCGDDISGIQTTDWTVLGPPPGARVSWHLRANSHNLEPAWNNAPGGNQITIGLIDTGIDPDNTRLSMPIFASGQSVNRTITTINKFRVSQEGNNVNDQCGHGTKMAALLANPRPNDASLTGIAFRSNLVAYRIGNGVVFDGTDERAAVVNSFSDAANRNDLRVISFSLGTITVKNDVRNAIEFAFAKGKLIFAAAGSGGFDVFPAKTGTTETIAVTGVEFTTNRTNLTRNGQNAIGAFVDFATFLEEERPGDNRFALTSRINQGGDVSQSKGSSGAVATCAGIAALVWSVNPYLTRNQVQNILVQSGSMGNNRNANYGWGVIDASVAVNLAVATVAPPSGVSIIPIGPTVVTTSGFYEWVAESNSIFPLAYAWNGGPSSVGNTVYSQYITVPSTGNTTYPITVSGTETAGAGRTFTINFNVTAASDPNGELPE